MNLKIRKACSLDYNELRKIVREVHNLHLLNRPDVYRDVENPLVKEYFDELLKEEGTTVFVVENENENGNELVAYSIVKFKHTGGIPVAIPKRFAYIDDFCVRSMDKRTGVGKILFQHIKEYVKEQKVNSIELQVWEFNEDAIKFYEKLGMRTRNRKMEIDL